MAENNKSNNHYGDGCSMTERWSVSDFQFSSGDDETGSESDSADEDRREDSGGPERLPNLWEQSIGFDVAGRLKSPETLIGFFSKRNANIGKTALPNGIIYIGQDEYSEDGGPGSGNWGHAGREGKIGGSAKGGGSGNREYRNKLGFISKKHKGDEERCARARKRGEDARAKLPKMFKDSHETWENCRKAAESGNRIPSASKAAKDHTIPGASPEAQAAYDKARKCEPEITRDMIDIASANGNEMYGLDYAVKTGASMAEKIERKKAAAKTSGIPQTDEEIVQGLGDMVRYTQLCPHDKTAETARKTIDALKKKGYRIDKVDNKWNDSNSDYKGLHIDVVSPTGQKFELQIHSKESIEVKEQIHHRYNETRKASASAYVRDELGPEMRDISKKLKTPEGMNGIRSERR